MSGGQFSWKPSFFGHQVTVNVDRSGVTVDNGNELRRVDYLSLKSIRYWRHRYRGTVRQRLYLMIDGGVVRIGVSGPARGSENSRTFAAAAAAIMKACAAARPDLAVERGLSGAEKKVGALAFFAAAIVGLGFAARDSWPFDIETLIPLAVTAAVIVVAGFVQFIVKSKSPPISAAEMAREFDKQAQQTGAGGRAMFKGFGGRKSEAANPE